MKNLPATSSYKGEEREKLHRLLGELLINVTNQVFKDRELYVDGYRFINCSFQNCTLYANRGTFEFHRCFETGTGHIFNHEALKSIQFYFMYKPELAFNDSFNVIKHKDGSFSIGQGVRI